MTMIPMRFLSNRPSFPFGPLCLGVVCLVGVAILLAGCARPQEVHEEASISNEFQNVDRGQNVDGGQVDGEVVDLIWSLHGTLSTRSMTKMTGFWWM